MVDDHSTARIIRALADLAQRGAEGSAPGSAVVFSNDPSSAASTWPPGITTLIDEVHLVAGASRSMRILPVIPNVAWSGTVHSSS